MTDLAEAVTRVQAWLDATTTDLGDTITSVKKQTPLLRSDLAVLIAQSQQTLNQTPGVPIDPAIPVTIDGNEIGTVTGIILVDDVTGDMASATLNITDPAILDMIRGDMPGAFTMPDSYGRELSGNDNED